jgi:hypothetical protein
MPGPEFFQTGMGRKFYEADVPRIAKGIERLAAALEKANELEEAKGAVSAPDNLKGLTDQFSSDAHPEDQPFHHYLDPLLAEQDGLNLSDAELGNGVGDVLRMLKRAGDDYFEITDPDTVHFVRKARVRLELAKSQVTVELKPGIEGELPKAIVRRTT